MTEEAPREHCDVCGFRRIPGLSSCVNCGEPAAAAFPMEIRVVGPPGMLPFDPERDYAAEAAVMRERSRQIMEGRALEYAGDVAGAIAIYEGLVAGRCPYTPPYRRLVIVYGKEKRTADEERVVRAALAQFGGGPGDWFVLRLAKILAKRRKPLA